MSIVFLTESIERGDTSRRRVERMTKDYMSIEPVWNRLIYIINPKHLMTHP